jgi:hypothetical protein
LSDHGGIARAETATHWDSQGNFCLALTAAFLSQLLTSVVVHAGRTFTAEVLQFNLSQPVARVIIGCEQMTLLEQAT